VSKSVRFHVILLSVFIILQKQAESTGFHANFAVKPGVKFAVKNRKQLPRRIPKDTDWKAVF
jgi:hypothetical protein